MRRADSLKLIQQNLDAIRAGLYEQSNAINARIGGINEALKLINDEFYRRKKSRADKKVQP